MDWNNDGKKDLISGSSYDYGRVKVFINTGSDRAPTFQSGVFVQVGGVDFRPGNRSMPEVVDWNNDGKKDLLCGEEAYGRVRLLLNSGTDTAPVFTTVAFVQNSGSDLSLGESTRSSPVVTDWDGDGKKDLLVGVADGTIHFFRNKGTDAAPVFDGDVLLRAGGATLDVGGFARPEVADWDGDGRKDLIVGSESGQVWFFRANDPSGPRFETVTSAWFDANGNGYMERGERGSLRCAIRNLSAGCSGVVATLGTSSPWCTVSQDRWMVGDVASNGVADNVSSLFEILVASNAPYGHKMQFWLDISAAGAAHTELLYLDGLVDKPLLALQGAFLNDVAGNSDGMLNAGESVSLHIRLTNAGCRAENVRATLGSGSYMTVAAPAVFGAIEDNTTARSAYPLCLNVSTTAPARHAYVLDLAVTYDGCMQTDRFPLAVGAYAIDCAADFAWIDTSVGIPLGIYSLSSKMVTLPFSFPLYGRKYDTVCVTANGQLLFGTNSASLASNGPIPNKDDPNAMIAPFWDYLDPNNGGTIRHLTVSVPERAWVVEWNAVPFMQDNANHCTFQAILYETGKIKFQYGLMSGGPYAYGSSATIGIEDWSGTFGVQHAFNQTNSVRNGQAIKIEVASPVADGDQDGMPDAYEVFYFGGTQGNGLLDRDGDGVSDRDEFRCGTDPLNGGSVLRMEGATMRSDNKLVLEWQGVPGLYYTVQGCANLSDGSWTNVATGCVVAPSARTCVHTTAVEKAWNRFYRVKTP